MPLPHCPSSFDTYLASVGLASNISWGVGRRHRVTLTDVQLQDQGGCDDAVPLAQIGGLEAQHACSRGDNAQDGRKGDGHTGAATSVAACSDSAPLPESSLYGLEGSSYPDGRLYCTTVLHPLSWNCTRLLPPPAAASTQLPVANRTVTSERAGLPPCPCCPG